MSAVKTNNEEIISSLKIHYPSLFSDEFDEFITNMSASIMDIKAKYGEDFQKIIEPEKIKLH